VATGNGKPQAGQDDQLIVLGKIGAPWGVKGWFRLTSYTDPREALLDYRDCFLAREGSWQPARIEQSRQQGNALVGCLDGVSDRDAAIAFRGAEIAVPRDAMPDPGDGHYYWSDLVGLTVIHRDGRELGKVKYLLATGEHDVLVVQGDKEVLIPFVMETFVLDVDLDKKLINVDWEWD